MSFNNDTDLTDQEKQDPSAALRRRIALATLKDKMVSFKSFRNVDFLEKELNDWLGSTPCVS